MGSSSISSWVACVGVIIFSLYALAVSHYKLDIAATVCWLPAVVLFNFAVVRLGRGFYPASFNTDITRHQASVLKSKRFRLVGMPISHFVEKVRWCMDIIKCPYEETTAGGLLTMFGRGRSVPFLIDSESCSVIGNSDEIIMYLHGVFVPALLASLPPAEAGPAAAAKRLAVNKLFERTDETIEFERELNTFGHAIQGWAYSYHLSLFTNPNPSTTFLAWGGAEPRVSALERLIIWLLYPLFRVALNITFQLTDEKLREARRAVICAMLDKVDAMLVRQKERYVARLPKTRSRSPKGRGQPAGESSEDYQPFLFGDHISYVDLTFCALVAPLVGFSVVFPKDGSQSLYAAGRFSSFRCFPGQTVRNDVLKDPQEPIVKLEEEIISNRPCGQYIMNMYRNHRKTPII